jgi:hypothetical protein
MPLPSLMTGMLLTRNASSSRFTPMKTLIAEVAGALRSTGVCAADVDEVVERHWPDRS